VIYDSRFTICDFAARWRQLIGFVLLAGCLPVSAPAHDSPEHVVEKLTALIKEQGRSADLLWRRATEYRELDSLESAAADLREAIALKPDFLTARADLGRVQLRQGKTDLALETLNEAVSAASDEASRAPLYLTRAEIHADRGELADAAADCERAIGACPEPEPDWYLLRGQMLLRLGKARDAAAGLKQGFDQTGSAVLEAEWIDAMLDAGQARAALEHIEPPLSQSRCRSSWLIRRARARLTLGQTARARGDLHAAVTEINGRLSPTHPEMTLLLDRGLALALLGDSTGAGRDLAAARKAGADASAARRLEAQLATKPRRGIEEARISRGDAD
jgi:tetratricopeptide (TPR) repeat protein